MPTAQHLRAQIEANLAQRIPSALTPLPRVSSPVAPTGIREIDALLHGGLPVGAISEIVGPECSGRTSLALTFVAGMTQAGKVCAWVDVSDTLHPESAAAIGVDLSRLLWIRCGASPYSTFAFQCGRKNPRQSRLSQGVAAIPDGGKGFCRGQRSAGRRSSLCGSLQSPAEPKEKVRSSPIPCCNEPAPDVSGGHGWNRDCGLPICCCRQVASVASCWTWAA